MIRTVQLRPVHLLAADLRWTSGSTRANSPSVSYQLGDPGRPSPEPTITIVIADDSGSVIGPAGADPVSNRYEEASRAFRAIGRRGGKHELGAVLHFDTPTSGDVPPTPLTRAGLQRLRSGLHVPHDAAGASYLGASLNAATALAKHYRNHEATLVVLSDFELFDDNVDQVLDDLADFPGDVHAIVLGGTQLDGLLDERVQITKAAHTDAPGTVARAIFTSLVAHRPGSRPI
ncbi:VWA domain-containing protein [Kribbella antibiotica]|uniref:VWA domain-containing protein n=1 Tax=Kribbella antibiotica TaxID=190195 RepID=A0A4R4ZXY4_9ACTN|nr:VWA domain-containing protein [Kribbella antibiotica]TDD62042.1 VWA domain-containing protein [Kribbella antibiotica]